MGELLQKMQVLTESKRRAGMIVRGLSDSSSGWYDSPDDLEVVIASEIDAAAACATERLTAELAEARKLCGEAARFVAATMIVCNHYPEDEPALFTKLKEEAEKGGK